MQSTACDITSNLEVGQRVCTDLSKISNLIPMLPPSRQFQHQFDVKSLWNFNLKEASKNIIIFLWPSLKNRQNFDTHQNICAFFNAFRQVSKYSYVFQSFFDVKNSMSNRRRKIDCACWTHSFKTWSLKKSCLFNYFSCNFPVNWG